MKAGALSDEKVVGLLNSKFVPIHINLESPAPKLAPKVAELTKKFNVRGIPHISFLSPDGTEDSSMRTVGGLDANGLLSKLKKIAPSIQWQKNGETATQIAKQKIIPVATVVVSADSANQDFWDGVEETFLWGANRFVWKKKVVEESVESTVKLEDPFDKSKTVTYKTSEKKARDKLKSFISRFEDNHVAENKWFCTVCNKVKSASKQPKCCDKEAVEIRSFVCESCWSASKSHGECHDADRKVVLKEVAIAAGGS